MWPLKSFELHTWLTYFYWTARAQDIIHLLEQEGLQGPQDTSGTTISIKGAFQQDSVHSVGPRILYSSWTRCLVQACSLRPQPTPQITFQRNNLATARRVFWVTCDQRVTIWIPLDEFKLPTQRSSHHTFILPSKFCQHLKAGTYPGFPKNSYNSTTKKTTQFKTGQRT